MNNRISEDLLSILCANRQEDDDRLVMPLVHRLMHRMFSPALEGRPLCRPCFWIRLGRDGARPSKGIASHTPPYMCSITLSPNAEHLISVAPSINRAKSYVTRLLAIAPFNPLTIKSAASVQPR